MKYVTLFLEKCLGATAEPASLLVEPTEKGYSVAVVNGVDGETVTLESDWQIEVVAEGETLAEALAALDEICREDYL